MSSFFRYFFAVFLIGAGVMLVLSNVGVVDFGMGSLWHNLYPVFILVMGLKWFIDFLRKRGTHWFLGIFFTIFGSLLILDRFDVLTFYFKDVFKLWPLLIIYIGFQILGFGSFGSGSIIINTGGSNKSSKNYKEKQFIKPQNFVAVDHDYSQPNWRAEPMNIRTMAGDFYLDFSKAYIPEKETPIHIRSLAGDVHILVPENIEFRIEAEVKAGEIEVLGNEMGGINRTHYYETDHYAEAERKLDFVIRLKAGNIRLDLV